MSLKPPAASAFHQFISFRIGIPDEVYKCRSNDVRQMADRSGNASRVACSRGQWAVLLKKKQSSGKHSTFFFGYI